MIINAIGCAISVLVMMIFAITKFANGAWFTVILIPALVILFLRVHRHYADVAKVLSMSHGELDPEPLKVYSVALIDDVHRGTVDIVKFTQALGSNWEAVHFNDDDEKTRKILVKWKERMGRTNHELNIVNAPYRNIVQRCEEYIGNLKTQMPGTIIHVVMGQIVMDTWAARALHSNTSIGMKLRLEQMDDVVVTDVSYPIHATDVPRLAAP